MKSKTILFRADSSSTIGTGHIMRDLVLAKQYAKKGATVIFATQELKGNVNQKIIDAGYVIERVKSNSKKDLVNLVNKLNIVLLVIDHYSIDYKKEKYIKEKTGVKILSFDDTYEKHYCDILLNHNISANKKKYKNLVPNGCKLKCGSKYTLLREEFYEEKKKHYKKSKKVKTVFLAMGGADTANLNVKILKVLKKFHAIRVNVVTTKANKNLKNLKEYTQNKKWIKLHIDSNKIAKLMKKSDFAIITPSVTLNEVYFMELPFIAIKTANNQNDIYKYLKENRYLTFDRFNIYKLKNELKKLRID
jgi:UDP-2,4-diacetamido-2,4,6-trideoxy-beta-L-altropyranose hydrolase